MKLRSPSLEGFKTIFRHPSFGFAEIAWRWSLGLAGVLLLTVCFIEYLDTLPVTPEDMFLLRTHQPVLIGRALQHVLHGSALRMAEAGLLLGLAFAVAWVVVAALGRAATLKALVSYFAEQSLADEVRKHWRIQSLYGLNSLRAAASLAAAVGWLGATALAGAVSPNANPSPGNATLVFIFVIALVNLAWLVVNWFLSLASVFVVAEGEDTMGAITAAVDFCRRRAWPVLAASFWFGLAHFVFFLITSFVAVLALSFLTVLPGAVVCVGIVLVTLGYFAIVDFLYIARLGAYVYIASAPEDIVIPEVTRPQPGNPHSPAGPSSNRIDPDELILSDSPITATP